MYIGTRQRLSINLKNLILNYFIDMITDTSLINAPPPPPIITHTAATPQDSPNAAHESRDFRRFQSLTPYTFLPFDTNGSGFSIDSIDCSVVRKMLFTYKY